MTEKILIVDDDLDTLKLVGLMLQRQGYDITAASTGGQALQKAAEEIPNLILLDVMMPDMDGYEVTRKLRSNSDLAHIPIIMFTAKTMVDDKVAGFEAGADDYMTKPTHPAELVSRVKALLMRTASRGPAVPADKGTMIGIIGPKGGMGATTLALNLGVGIVNTGKDTIVCDLRPGQGNLGLMLGLHRTTGLSEVLKMPVNQISAEEVDKQLIHHETGLRLLVSSYDPQDIALTNEAADQAEAAAMVLSGMSDYLVLDLGSSLNDISSKVISKCDELIVIVEPIATTLTMAQALLDGIENVGMSRGRVSLVMVNRIQSSNQLSRQQIEDEMGARLKGIITPAPELAYQAMSVGKPMMLVRSDSLVAQQFSQLAREFAKEKQTEG